MTSFFENIYDLAFFFNTNIGIFAFILLYIVNVLLMLPAGYTILLVLVVIILGHDNKFMPWLPYDRLSSHAALLSADYVETKIGNDDMVMTLSDAHHDFGVGYEAGAAYERRYSPHCKIDLTSCTRAKCLKLHYFEIVKLYL